MEWKGFQRCSRTKLPAYSGRRASGPRDDLIHALQHRTFLFVPRRSAGVVLHEPSPPDRKSTRLNSSHLVTSYAVFCLKKQNNASDIHQSHCELKMQCGRAVDLHGWEFVLLDLPDLFF